MFVRSFAAVENILMLERTVLLQKSSKIRFGGASLTVPPAFLLSFGDLCKPTYVAKRKDARAGVAVPSKDSQLGSRAGFSFWDMESAEAS